MDLLGNVPGLSAHLLRVAVGEGNEGEVEKYSAARAPPVVLGQSSWDLDDYRGWGGGVRVGTPASVRGIARICKSSEESVLEGIRARPDDCLVLEGKSVVPREYDMLRRSLASSHFDADGIWSSSDASRWGFLELEDVLRMAGEGSVLVLEYSDGSVRVKKEEDEDGGLKWKEYWVVGAGGFGELIALGEGVQSGENGGCMELPYNMPSTVAKALLEHHAGMEDVMILDRWILWKRILEEMEELLRQERVKADEERREYRSEKKKQSKPEKHDEEEEEYTIVHTTKSISFVGGAISAPSAPTPKSSKKKQSETSKRREARQEKRKKRRELREQLPVKSSKKRSLQTEAASFGIDSIHNPLYEEEEDILREETSSDVAEEDILRGEATSTSEKGEKEPEDDTPKKHTPEKHTPKKQEDGPLPGEWFQTGKGGVRKKNLVLWRIASWATFVHETTISKELASFLVQHIPKQSFISSLYSTPIQDELKHLNEHPLLQQLHPLLEFKETP